MTKLKLPPISHVAKYLTLCKPKSTEEDMRDMDGYISLEIRLQVYEDGRWAVRKGPSDYDLDHCGYWGASSLSPRSNCREVAKDLIYQVADHWAQCQ